MYNKYKKIIINPTVIYDWDTFHNFFSNKLGFPDYYGRNMDAWIDLISYLNTEANDCDFSLDKGQMLILEIQEAKEIKINNP